MQLSLKTIALTAFVGLSACTPRQPSIEDLDLPPKQYPLPEFTAQEARNVVAMSDFLHCVLDQGGMTILNSPWANEMLEHCSSLSSLNEEMIHDVFNQFQYKYGHSWPDMVEDLLSPNS